MHCNIHIRSDNHLFGGIFLQIITIKHIGSTYCLFILRLAIAVTHIGTSSSSTGTGSGCGERFKLVEYDIFGIIIVKKKWVRTFWQYEVTTTCWHVFHFLSASFVKRQYSQSLRNVRTQAFITHREFLRPFGFPISSITIGILPFLFIRCFHIDMILQRMRIVVIA